MPLGAPPINAFKMGFMFPQMVDALLAAPDVPVALGPTNLDHAGIDSTGGVGMLYAIAIYVPLNGSMNSTTGGPAQAIPRDIPCTMDDCAECFADRNNTQFWGEATDVHAYPSLLCPQIRPLDHAYATGPCYFFN